MIPAEPVAALAAVDVADLVAWIEGIPFTAWPPGDLTQLRPAMVTNPKWYGLGERTDALVLRLRQVIAGMMGASYVDTHRWLSVVMPGHTIDTHADAPEPGWLRRVHVPLTTNPDAIIVADGRPYHLEVGTAYLFDKTSRHSVRNGGTTPRVHFMFDAIRA